jgi:hypothetical protein
MKNLELFKKDFKRDLLVKIVVSLKHGKTNKGKAKSLAREILSIFRESEAGSIFSKLNKLSESYPAVLDVFIKRGYEFDNREKEEKVNQIIVYLTKKEGEIN